MKKRQQKLLSFIPVIVLLISTCGYFLLGHRTKIPNPTSKPTVVTSGGSKLTSLKQPGNTPGKSSDSPTVGSSSRAGKSIDSTKHNSSLLKKYSTSKEVPYYLMTTPTDPYYSGSWHLNTVQASRGWDLTTGSSNTIIAVIDSPFALNHQDLVSRWHVNSSETGNTQVGDVCWTGSALEKSSNNCDDDGNGYIDDWRGYDFFNSDNNVQTGLTNPDGSAAGHATAIAGTIAATANNNAGSAGLDWNAKIMALQVFSDDGEAYSSDVVSAIQYAVDNGADIINLSLGTNVDDPALLGAVRYAKSHDVLVVAASGNCANNDIAMCNNLPAPGRMTYPARYSEVLSVGATTSTDARASFSSYGPELDITAPGNAIGPVPTYVANNSVDAYATVSGTSFSTPIVSAIASLVKSQNPLFSPAEIESILKDSSEKVSAMLGSNFTNEHGNGRVNAHQATLLGLAKTQTNLLGTRALSPRENAVGYTWRANSGSIANNESVLVGCRSPFRDCNVTVENGATYRFNSINPRDDLQYIFVKGSAVPAGTWKISVHSNEYATFVSNLVR